VKEFDSEHCYQCERAGVLACREKILPGLPLLYNGIVNDLGALMLG